jgi:hypothetical protein
MTETQRKFLTEYLGECWHSQETYYDCEKGYIVRRRTFTDLKDKQDLLEAVINRREWMDFCSMFIDSHKNKLAVRLWKDISDAMIMQWLIQLTPLETAELICKWKWQPDGLTKEERK